MSERYLVVGGGIAGLTAVDEIIRRKPGAAITVINGEPFPPYYRAALSFYFQGAIGEEKLFMRPGGWAGERGVRIVNDRVAALHDVEKKVVTAAGLTVEYDKLLIATGAEPFVPSWPGHDKKGVVTYRTLVCVNRQKEIIKERQVKRALVVGGGILGIELTENFRAQGIEVTLLERGESILSLLFHPENAALIAAAMEKDGVTIRTGVEVAEVTGDQWAGGVILTNGETIAADLIGVAVGVRPVASFLEDSRVTFDRGVMVDRQLATTASDVWAAGDAAVIKEGDRVWPCRTWLTAARMGQVAGANMTGAHETFAETFINSSHVYGNHYAVVGEFNPPPGEDVERIRLDTPEGEGAWLTVRQGEVVGGQFVGNSRPGWQLYHAFGRGQKVGAAECEWGDGCLLKGVTPLAYTLF